MSCFADDITIHDAIFEAGTELEREMEAEGLGVTQIEIATRLCKRMICAVANGHVPEIAEDEPFFILVGRDPMFAPTVEAWAHGRTGNVAVAQKAFESVISAARQIEPQRNDDPQILSAFRLAGAGRAYQTTLALRPNPKPAASVGPQTGPVS